MPITVMFILGVLVIGILWLIFRLFWGTPPNINLAVGRFTLWMILKDPETLTSLGLLDNTPLDFHSGKLTDASPAYMARLRRLETESLALIRRNDPRKLSGQDWLTYQFMRWYFEQKLQGHRFDYHWYSNQVFMGPYPVNHVFGVHIDLVNFLSIYHKIRGGRSMRRYIQRLKMIPWKLSGLQDSVRTRFADGILPPRFVLEKSIRQIDDFLTRPLDENPLYFSFMDRANKSRWISDSAAASWGERVKKTIQEEVFPAYQALLSLLREMLPNAGEEDGLWHLPNGAAYYEFLLREHTTIDLTPEEIHQLGLREVDRLLGAIREVLAGLGSPSAEPGKQLQVLMADSQYHYQDDNARQAIIEDYQAILDEVNKRLPTIFNQGSLDEIAVKRLPDFREPDSPIAYAEAPSLDGSRPGTMWINLREPGNVYRWGMRTLAYHEGIPGHVYQMAQALKIKGLASLRRAYSVNAYVEGWALYAERLGWELGLEDELSNLGRLQALLWRAARLVVDTGIHVKQWTREQAITYMVETTGLPERDVITEVERYIVMPGQACAYLVGYLKLVSLRQKAESTLGDTFDLKAFHDVVIKNGSLPLALLEKVVNDYIDQSSGLKDLDS